MTEPDHREVLLAILMDFAGVDAILPENSIESLGIDSLDLAVIEVDIEDRLGVSLEPGVIQIEWSVARLMGHVGLLIVKRNRGTVN